MLPPIHFKEITCSIRITSYNVCYTKLLRKNPVLVLNALDDPFLGEGCFPVQLAQNNAFIYLETPKYGGHCAYPMKNSHYSYAEIRALEFINSLF